VTTGQFLPNVTSTRKPKPENVDDSDDDNFQVLPEYVPFDDPNNKMDVEKKKVENNDNDNKIDNKADNKQRRGDKFEKDDEKEDVVPMEFDMEYRYNKNKMMRPQHVNPSGVTKVKDYKLDEIAPTAKTMKIDAENSSHPNTLPFIDFNLKKVEHQFEDLSIDNIKDKVMGIDVTTEDKYKSMSERKVTTSYAASLFMNEEKDDFPSEQLFFIQLPTQLPFSIEETEDKKKKGFENNLSSVPEGRIGKLAVFRSGIVKLRIGDITFDVSQGMPCNFLQEVAVIDSNNGKIYQLGDINNRMVTYPDIQSILKKKKSKKEKENNHN